MVSEYSPDDTSPPSVYVTYSMDNVPKVLTGKDSIYTGDPIDSVYPVHNATLHINGRPYHGQNRSFTCVITEVNDEFLQQYNVSNDDLRHFMLIYINASLELSSSGLFRFPFHKRNSCLYEDKLD